MSFALFVPFVLPASAQPSAPGMDISVGAGFIGGSSLGSADADLRSSGSPFQLFATTSRLGRSVPLEVRIDFLLGPREWPSPARTVAQFFYNYRHVELKLGEPIDLKSFVAKANGQSEAALVRRLTYAVLRRLERERRSVTGPSYSS